ncbi:MAG: hypothetical protein Kow0029_01290 [Candidatus Rifleibacteriota bacterium]
MIRKNLKKKNGVAIAVVLVFCVAVLGLVTILVFNTRQHKGSFDLHYDQTRALMAAQAAMQLAIYKYRVLPSEFYKLHELQKASAKNPGDPVLKAKADGYRDIWMQDFDAGSPGTPAAKIKENLDSVDNQPNATHEFRVEDFKLVSITQRGYIKDFIKIRTFGKYRNSEKFLEELVEVKIAE